MKDNSILWLNNLNRVYILFWVILLNSAIIPLTGASQERRKNPLELQQLSSSCSLEFAGKKAAAEHMASLKGWPVRIEYPDGRIIEIMEIGPNGMPEYDATDNINAAYTVGSDKLWPGGNSGLNLTGDGFTIGIWDGGAVRTSHQEFRIGDNPSRVTNKNSVANSSHATHVAGTMVAEGQVGTAQGMALAAGLHAYDWDNDVSEMLNANAVDGLILSNHSYGRLRGWNFEIGVWWWWGDTTISRDEDYQFGFYGDLAKTWDSMAYVMQDYLFVKSIGNSRGEYHAGSHYVWAESLGDWILSTWPREPDGGPDGYDCIENRAVAKNILTVGAVDDIPGGYSGPDDVVMTTFSSWGPADDGRIKPDIVANGVQLLSTDDDTDYDYTVMSGTSMAAPNVCGTLALLQDYHHELTGSYLYSDELKALVINTAFEAGLYPGPDYQFGWGLLNAEGAAELITLEDTEGGHIGNSSLVDGETKEYFYYADGSSPVNVTLVWTDPPHAALVPALDPATLHLVNDLNVRINCLSTDSVYCPWTLDPSSPGSAAIAADNYRDNVEKITIANPSQGYYIVTVSHDGLLSLPQNYALVVSGMRLGVPGKWIGITSSDWLTLSNWDYYEVPDATTHVTIPAGCMFYPVLESDLGVNYASATAYVCDSLTVASGAELTIHNAGLKSAGYINLEGTLYAGSNVKLYEGSVIDLSGSLYTGYSSGFYGDFIARPGSVINLAGGTLYTEKINLHAGCHFNDSEGYCRIYAQGDVPSVQDVQVNDTSNHFCNFIIEENVYAQLYNCNAGLNADQFTVNGTFTLNDFTITSGHADIYGTLNLTSGFLDVLMDGPYFHNGSVLNMSGGELNSNQSLRFFSGALENVSGGTITLQGDFYDQDEIFSPAGGDFYFVGINAADIHGPTSFYDLHINKTYPGIDAVENGTGDGQGVDIFIQNSLEIAAGSFELNSPCTLTVVQDILIDTLACLNADDGPGVYIQSGDDWINNAGDAGFLAGTGLVYLTGSNPSPDQQEIEGIRQFYGLINRNVTNAVKLSGPLAILSHYDAGASSVCNTMITGKSVNINMLYLFSGTFEVSGSLTTVVLSNYRPGGIIKVTDGHLVINNYSEDDLEGTYILYGGILDLTKNGTGAIDNSANIAIHGGQMTISGGSGMSYWSGEAGHSFEMSGGILDYRNMGIFLSGNLMNFTITGGKIRTAGSFYSSVVVNNFHPAGNTVELYGTGVSNINLGTGSWFYDLTINKTTGTVLATRAFRIKNSLKIQKGTFRTNNYTITVGP